MKTYALYLLMLCFSVMGCQKDIGENEADLAAKKDNHCKCKVLYLPIWPSSSYDTVVVKLNNGGQKYIIDQGRIINTYNKFNQPVRWESWDLMNNRLDDEWNFYYKNNQISSYNNTNYSYPLGGGVRIGKFDHNVVRDKGNLKNIYRKRSSNSDSRIYEDTVSLTYYPDNSIKSYRMYSGSYVSQSETFINNDKNYFAKDIENLELIFLTGIGYQPTILPTNKDISSSIYYNAQTLEPYTHFNRYIDKEYNEAGYPVFYRAEVEIHDKYGVYTQTDERRITYRKVVIKK